MNAKLCIGALLLAGCATQAPELSAHQWTFTPPEWRSQQASAQIFAPTGDKQFPVGDDYIGVTCFVESKELMFTVGTSAKLSGSGSDRVLTMAFDGEVPKPQKDWLDDGQSFALFEHDARLRDVVAQLRRHRQVEFVSKNSFGELWRRTFPLTGADAAIAQVLKACEKEK